jgi:hypothetical protein
MPTISEVRSQYPQYADLSDEQLAKGLHQKYYSDLPFEEFSAKIGLQAPKQPAPADPSLYNQGDELGKMLLRGARTGARATGLAGRTILNAAAGIPLLAADAGIATRNAITGEQNESAKSMYERSLNDMGVPQFETPIEKGGDFVGQVLIGSKIPAPSAGNAAPAAFNPQSMRALAFEKARDAGYSIPPATTNPTLLNRFLESWGGKVATAQDASVWA